MRTRLPAAAPCSGRPDSSPLSGPAQAAARDLPRRRERKAGRGETSSVRHGAVWKNPGEAAQRAGKGSGGGTGVGASAWGCGGVGERLDALPPRLARCRSAPISGASHSIEGPEEVLKEAAVGKENPGVPFPQGGRGPGEGVPRSRLGARRPVAPARPLEPLPRRALVRPARNLSRAQAPPPPGRLPKAGGPAGSLASSSGAHPEVGKVQAPVVPSPQPRLIERETQGLFPLPFSIDNQTHNDSRDPC